MFSSALLEIGFKKVKYFVHSLATQLNLCISHTTIYTYTHNYAPGSNTHTDTQPCTQNHEPGAHNNTHTHKHIQTYKHTLTQSCTPYPHAHASSMQPLAKTRTIITRRTIAKSYFFVKTVSLIKE